jgi:NTP pyrophosphatase (non-canonical NTP hydrolase)
LTYAIAVEAGEFLQLFQWLTPEESQAIMEDARLAQAVDAEIADVLTNVIMLANALDIDLEAVLEAKIVDNERRYPIRHRRVAHVERSMSALPPNRRRDVGTRDETSAIDRRPGWHPSVTRLNNPSHPRSQT